MSSKNQTKDACGCCKGLKTLTPAALDNLPGLSSLAYRVGTHGSFKTTMIAALSGQKALGGLTIRDDDDTSIALVDAWACVLDVLTFYQERIANEGYLMTASERSSVLELARAIGYELKPGVAAGTFLAFTLENAPGTPGYATIDTGIKVMSIPGQNEKPQTFETVEKIEARAAWNELKPRLTELKIPGMGSKEVFLKGTATGLKPGDSLLFVGKEREQEAGSERWDFRTIKTVNADKAAGYTKVTWDEGLGWQRFKRKVLPAEEDFKVYAFHLHASLFGNNAPDWRTMPDNLKKIYLSKEPTSADKEWPNFTISSNDTISLDAVYPRITQGSWVVLSIPNYEEVYEAMKVEEVSRTDYSLIAKTTRLKLSGENLKEKFDNKLRETTVFAQSEQLDIAEALRTDSLSGNIIELDKLVSRLPKGKLLIISGKRMPATPGDMVISEVVELAGASDKGNRTSISLKERMQNSYDPATVTIYANVARATHGETVREVLGSGSGARANQRFMLKKQPLTYVSAPTPSGTESTIEVRVNDVKWQEVPSLYDLDARIRGYIIRIDDAGNTALTFGDGKNGARLPSGQENVAAAYRIGIGMQGMVKANQLSLLMTRPLGVKGVTNPLAPAGADDPETRDQAKQNAPQKVLTLDRIVSLQDFEDFTRAFAGIGKARAAWLRDGEVRFVHITVACANAGTVDKMSTIYKNLWAGIEKVKDPVQQFRIDSFTPLFFNLSAGVLVDSSYFKEKVVAAVTDALKQAFSFERRNFGQAVTESEVIAVIQGVEGVTAVDLNELYIKEDKPELKAYLRAGSARMENGNQILAGLLTLNPGGIKLTEMRL